jgi:hypothetical protein
MRPIFLAFRCFCFSASHLARLFFFYNRKRENPEEQLTFQQKHCPRNWCREVSIPVYKMTPEPKSLEDFE